MSRPFDLDAYLARIAYDGPREPTRAVLDRLHEAHAAAIPFENLDVRLGRPISLDLGALQAKLVTGGRGGYCFEQNTLFAAALRALGFPVRTLEARVRPPGSATVLPRTHMTLCVELPRHRPRLADVGFGADGPLRSVPLDGRASEQPGGAWRAVAEEGSRVLQRQRAGIWVDLYAFSLVPALPVDYEVANHYTSTWPGSRFVQTATAQWSTARGRHVIRGRIYTCSTDRGEDTRTLSDAEFATLVRETLGLRLSDAEARAALGPAIAEASDQALLVSFGDEPRHEVGPERSEEVARLTRALRAEPPEGLLDLHPGYASVLVRYDPRRTGPVPLAERIQARLVHARTEGPGEPALVEIPVVYGGEHGPDLARVAGETGLSEERVVALHLGAAYRVCFLGFTAGFPYLAGLPRELEVPRLPRPRRTVPAGSVAIAGRQAGIYPQATPGGWRVIGRTPLRLFRPEEDPVALLRMGDRVRFVPAR